jgi:hypothetical protein
MYTVAITLLFGLFCYLIGHMVGFDKGQRIGEQQGKLDQHLYNERVNAKRRKP